MATSFAHDVALALSSDAPFAEVMGACAVPLLQLTGARDLALAVRDADGDRIAYRSRPTTPAADALALE